MPPYSALSAQQESDGEITLAGRTVFFVSDGTGITAETFGSSILAQFDRLKFRLRRIPFVDTMEKADQAANVIETQAQEDGKRPIVFSTLVNTKILERIKRVQALHLDIFQTFVEPLERELHRPVITSNTATMWHCLRKMGIPDRVEGFGRLLRDY